MFSNYNRLCRICLREGSSISLDTKLENSTISYFDLMKTCIFPEITYTEEYPRNICDDCIKLLDALQSLKTIFLCTEEKLKRSFEKRCDTVLKVEQPVENPPVFSANETEGASDKEKPFSCSQCNKSFRRFEHLKVHERIHTGERPFECTKCPKKFVQRATLDQHLRTHSGERPYMCSICGKSFSQPTSLTYHLRIHTKEKPFPCNFCEKRFIQRNNLNIHLRFHKNERPHRCEKCDKQFFTKSHLKMHTKQHLGERDHVCTICHKKFLRNEHLKLHFLSHKGEKPHKCDCGKAFSQKGHLNRHMKIHERKNDSGKK